MNYSITFPPSIKEKIDLPASKSITNRVLLINALGRCGKSLQNCAVCDDISAMRCGLDSDDAVINVGAAGTAMRFLTAYYSLQEGRTVTLDGNARMRQRPIGILVDALKRCGAEIEYTLCERFPPLRIVGQKLHSPGILELRGDVSSQFVSAIIMIAPCLDKPIEFRLLGEMTSIPYIDMTIAIMRRSGIEIERRANIITVVPGHYALNDYKIESDWSAASYWYEIAVLMQESEICLNGLLCDSVQGDSRTGEIFQCLGLATDCDGHLSKISHGETSFLKLDMNDCPDIIQTVVVASCLLGKHFVISGTHTLRIKETDRIGALKNELCKLGYVLEVVDDDHIAWRGKYCKAQENPVISTYGDHRMAMAFAPAAILFPGLTICDVDVVNKSYPQFWQQLERCGVNLIGAE